MSLLDMSWQKVQQSSAIVSEKDLKGASLRVSSTEVKEGESAKGKWHNLSLALEFVDHPDAKIVYDTIWLPTEGKNDKQTGDRQHRFRKTLQCFGIVPYEGDDDDSIEAAMQAVGELFQEWAAGTEGEDEFTIETAILNGLANALQDAEAIATLNCTGEGDAMRNEIRFYHYPSN